MGSGPNRLSLGAVFRIREVRRLWIGQFTSIMGDFLALYAAIAVVTFRMHGGPAQITAISIAYLIPLALLAPMAGVLIDRLPLKPVMVSSDVIRGLLACSLVFVRDLPTLCVIFFAISTVSTFFIPAQSVAIRSLVPAEGLLAANALMQQNMIISRIVAPPLAGLLIASIGAPSCFWADGASFLFSAVMIAGISIQRKVAPRTTAAGVKGVLADLSSGLQFILGQPSLVFVIAALAAALFTLGAASPLLAILIRDYVSGGTRLFGVVSGLVGFGMIAGTQLILRIARGRTEEAVATSGLVVLGLAIGVTAATRIAAVTGLGTFLMGVGIAMIVSPTQALLQHRTPLQMLGRVSSTVMAIVAIAQVLGLTVSGTAAHMVGIRPVFFWSAGALGVTALAGELTRRRAGKEGS